MIFSLTTKNLKSGARAKGFTIVELLVVLALFTTVITIATGALFSAQAINTKLQQTQIILDGVNLAMEEMIRDMRYSSVFYCSSTVPQTPPNRQNCAYPNGGSAIVFKPATGLTANNSSNDRVAYYLSSGVLYKQTFPEGVAGTPLQVTTSDVRIEGLTFYLKGAEATSAGTPDYVQPVITVALSGVTRPTQPHVTPVHFTVQTTTSSRKLDN